MPYIEYHYIALWEEGEIILIGLEELELTFAVEVYLDTIVDEIYVRG